MAYPFQLAETTDTFWKIYRELSPEVLLKLEQLREVNFNNGLILHKEASLSSGLCLD